MHIGETLWADFIKILREFGRLGEIENQDYLWEVIINIRKNMYYDLEKGIRLNFRICHLMGVEDQVKEINKSLFRLNHLFEQNFYRIELDSFQGLKQFHNMIEPTYGNLEKFIQELRGVKENLSFMRKHHDQILIEEYNYLQKIILPLRGYASLREEYTKVLSEMKKLKFLVTDPKAFQKLLLDIEVFKANYMQKYDEEHCHFQQKLNDFYKELHQLAEYKALGHLAGIEVIKVAYNMKPIKKYIDTFFPQKCDCENLVDILEEKPSCKCGFQLGDMLTIPSLDKIKPMLRNGIKEYIEQLQHERFHSLFTNYLRYNPDSFIGELLELKSDEINSLLEDILIQIDDKLIKEINEALSNTYPLKISFDELASAVGGTYSVNQLDLFTKRLSKFIIRKTAGMEEIGFDEIVINLIK